jgi:hypothetical protein
MNSAEKFIAQTNLQLQSAVQAILFSTSCVSKNMTVLAPVPMNITLENTNITATADAPINSTNLIPANNTNVNTGGGNSGNTNAGNNNAATTLTAPVPVLTLTPMQFAKGPKFGSLRGWKGKGAKVGGGLGFFG